MGKPHLFEAVIRRVRIKKKSCHAATLCCQRLETAITVGHGVTCKCNFPSYLDTLLCQ